MLKTKEKLKQYILVHQINYSQMKIQGYRFDYLSNKKKHFFNNMWYGTKQQFVNITNVTSSDLSFQA